MSTLKAAAISVAPQDIFTSSSTQGTDLGALASTGDSRYYRYCLAGGTTLVPGKLQAAPAQDTTNYNPSGGLAVAATAVGSTQVTLTGSLTITANALAGGYMSVNAGTGGTLGMLYKVKSNTAVSSATNCVVTLEDPILTSAFTTSTKVVFAVNPYNGVILNPATASSSPLGVAVYPVVNAQYGWIQTYGPCSLLNDNGTAIGLGLAPSGATAGAAKTMAATLSQIGYAMNVQVTTEYDLVYLTID